jgi:transcriptional regulator with XRE-family HTH domain
MASKGTDPVDRLVGRNIRIYRLQKGMSQTELADALGLTFQQVQKYEKGANRVGSGRLLKIATILGLDITALFKGSDDVAQLNQQSVFDELAAPQPVRLIQAFSKISNPGVRRSLVELAEDIVRSQ